MNTKTEPFNYSPETLDAKKRNLPGARSMSRIHNLIHQAEETNALGVGQDRPRTAYLCSLLDEAEALCAKARDELLRSPAGKNIVRLDSHDPKDAKLLAEIKKNGRAKIARKKSTREKATAAKKGEPADRIKMPLPKRR